MSWNHRVLKRTRRIGKPPRRETDFCIYECYYRGRPGPENEAHSSTVDPITPYGETLEELRETLVRMLKATYDPVLDYDNIGSRKKTNQGRKGKQS